MPESTATTKVINLNIGGTKYSTTLSTLTKYSKSKLAAIFSNEKLLASQDDKGSFFIDADADMFKYILNFLRRDELHLPNNFQEFDRLLGEAKFYQIQPLIEKIHQHMNPKRHSVLLCILTSANVITSSHFQSDGKVEIIPTGRGYEDYTNFLEQQGYCLDDTRKPIKNVFQWAGSMHTKGYITNPAVTCEGTDVSQFKRQISPYNAGFDAYEVWRK